MSLDYYAINSRAVDLLLSVKKHTSSINPALKSLVELRVSQINGCAYCVSLHSNEARQAGVEQQTLDCLPAWGESGLFAEKEMVALGWAEAVTTIAQQSDMDGQLSKLLTQFSEAEAVDLTVIISLMNCMNRIAISFGDKPDISH